MTQYLLSVWHDGDFEMPDPEVMQKVFAQVDAFNAEVQAAGAWVFAGGLHPRSSATVVRVKDGEVSMTDGPYAESKEQIGGFWVIAASRYARFKAESASATCSTRVSSVRSISAKP